MTVNTRERRANFRMPAAYSALITDKHRRVLVRGRTANISESGVYVLASAPVATDKQIVVELRVPSLSSSKPGQFRTVRYLSRVVHVEQVGQMFGLGIEMLYKLS